MKGYCISRVQKNARRLGMKLYDDRTGDMCAAFGMQANESNVLLIGPEGIVRYRKAGRLEKSEIDVIIELIRKMVRAAMQK